MKKSALVIGQFMKGENGVFTGKLETLAIKANITLQPNDDKAKDSRRGWGIRQSDYSYLHRARWFELCFKSFNNLTRKRCVLHLDHFCQLDSAPYGLPRVGHSGRDAWSGNIRNRYHHSQKETA
jgi:hypothetical protein